jgi:hypothetical protein
VSWRDNYWPGELEELGMQDWSPLEAPAFDNPCPECGARTRTYCVGLEEENLVHRPRFDIAWADRSAR